MPKIVGRNERGFVDPLSLFGLLFLVVTLAAVTFVTTNKNISLNIQEKAAKPGKTGNSAFDKCREESGREVCNERLGINVNWKGEIVNEIDTSNVDKDAPQGQPTCDANGVQYSPGAVVMYGGIGSNATCGSDGKWDVGVGATTDIKPENVPEYAKEAVEKEKEAEKQLTEQVAVPTTVTVEPEQIGLTQSTNQTSGTTVVQQPAVTAVTTTTQVGQPCTNCHLTPTQQTQNNVQPPSQQTVAQVINLMNEDNPVPPTIHYAVINNKLVTGTVETNKPAPQVLPDNNYGSCNGDPTCNSALTSIDRGMNAISFGGWSNYTEAYSPDKVKYTWQESGYKSVKECQDDMIAKNNNAQAAASCNTYQITKEQAISSIKLGTTLTAEAAAIIALPGAIGAGGTAITAGATTLQVGGAVLAPALTSFGAITTLTQTSAAAVAQITDPGSPEAWKQTGYAALSWLNIGTADKLIKSFGALDAAKKAGQATETLVTAAQSARNLNNVVSGINLAVDVPNAVSTCSQAGFFTGSCGGALAAVGADIVFGTVDYKQGQLGFGNPLTKVNEGALIGRIETPAEIDQINQLIANPFGTTPSISNVDGEVKFTPSRQLDMFDQLARDPVANTSTVVNNGTELIFPDKPARQDPNTNFNLTKSDPNEVAAIAAFNSTDINTQGGTVAQLTPSNLNSQIPNTPITDVTAPKPVEPNANIADDITKPLTGTANTDTVDSPATTNQSPTIASLLDDPNASVLDKANGVIDTLPDTGGAISIVKKINQIGDEIASALSKNVSTKNLTPKVFDATKGNMPKATEIKIPAKINIAKVWQENIISKDGVILPKLNKLPNEKLARGITGLDIGDPELMPRLIDDHYIIKAKYNLPPREMRFDNPREYINQLNQIAKDNGVEIRNVSEWENFFKTNRAGAAFDDVGNQIFVNFANEASNPIGYAGDLEHELVHGLQNKYSPGMPVEVMEYEAYVTANMRLNNKSVESENLQHVVFGNIKQSVDHWYTEKGLTNPWIQKTTAETTAGWIQRQVDNVTNIWNSPTSAKISNWVKAEMAKTNPNAFKNIGQDITTTFDNLKNGFDETFVGSNPLARIKAEAKKLPIIKTLFPDSQTPINQATQEVINWYHGQGTISEKLAATEGYTKSWNQNWLYSPVGKKENFTYKIDLPNGETANAVYKLHVTTTPKNFDKVVEETTAYLRDINILHKISPGPSLVNPSTTSSQYGKAITIYAEDPETIALIVERMRKLAQDGLEGISPQQLANKTANLSYERPVPDTNNLLYYTVEYVDGEYLGGSKALYASRSDYNSETSPFFIQGPIKDVWINSSQTLINSKVEDVVSKLNKLMDRVYPESPNLPECRAGLCGWVSDNVELAFKYNGFKTTQYQVVDLNTARGIVSPEVNSFKHAITVIEDDKGNKYLIDLTFSQFINKETGVIQHPVSKINTNFTIDNPVAKEIFEKGYIKLDEKTLNEYLNLTTSSDVTQPKVSLDILEQAKVRHEVQKYTLEEIKKYYPELVDQETSPPLTGFAKVQEQVGTVVKAGFSPLKYVAGGIVSAAFLDNYFDLGITGVSVIYALNNDKELSEISVANPNQRPYDEVIKEAIDNYTENNPDSDVYYSPNPQAMSLFDIFKQIFSKDSLNIVSSTLADEEYKELNFSGKIMSVSNNLLTDRNSFIDSVIGAAGNIGLFTKGGGTYPINGFDNEVKDLVILIEDEVQTTGHPVSHSFVIEYFLEKNNGDLAQAILDSSNFEELLVRSLDDQIVNEPYIWIQNNILDEYSPLLPYQTLPEQEIKLENSKIYYDYSLPNRLGEIYHAASITALLHYLPPEIIKGMVISEYLSYGNKHGLIKLSADLEVLKQLDNINDLLNSYVVDVTNPNQINPEVQKPTNIQQATAPKVNPVIQQSQNITEQQKLELERQAKIKSGLYAQIDADLATQTILGGAGKPFKNIGCGQVAVANILCEYGNYCPTPLQIAEQIPLQEYTESGLTSTQSNIKILNENGFTTDPYTKSLQYHLTEYMEPTDVLWISGIVGGIDHHTYIDGYTINENGVAIFNLNDSYFGDGYKCKTSGDSSFSCDNPDGSHINIGAENANIYIIDTNI